MFIQSPLKVALSVTCHREEELQSHKEDKVICTSTVGHHNDAKIGLSDRNCVLSCIKLSEMALNHWGHVII